MMTSRNLLLGQLFLHSRALAADVLKLSREHVDLGRPVLRAGAQTSFSKILLCFLTCGCGELLFIFH